MLDSIDHFVWAAPDLDQGCASIKSLFGVSPVPGGSHSGLGTRNALLSLGTDIYLEIMAPSADLPPANSIGARLAQLEAPGLATWVRRSRDLSPLAAAAKSDHVDVTPLGPVPTERLTPQGDRLAWELLFYTEHAFGGLVPFVIDWKYCPHPSSNTPKGGTVRDFEVQSQQAEALNELFEDLSIPQRALPSPTDALSLVLETPNGTVELQSTTQVLKVLSL
ncbi:MAG: VOC family protein [Pseudomonadota bacterium]